MALIVRSGATTDEWTIDPTSKAGRVTPYDEAGRVVAPQSKRTYFVTNTFTPPATPTDMVTIFGAAGKIITVVSFRITTTNTAAGSQQWFLIKRSGTNTGGTFVAGTSVPARATDGAGNATVGHYTANPSALGAAVGNVNIKRYASPVAVPATFAGIVQDAGHDMLQHMPNSLLDKPITLEAATEGLCLNFNGAALVAGQTHAYQIVYTEEP